MKLPLIIICLFSFLWVESQEVPDFVKRELDTMLYYDLLVRKQNMFGEKAWIAFNKKPKYFKDSIKQKIRFYDSINFDKLVRLLDNYGYTDYRNIIGLLLLHSISHKEVAILKSILDKVNPKTKSFGEDYGSWYDRYLLQVCKKPQLYGEYNHKYPCVESLDMTNKERNRIGLKPLKRNRCK